MHIDEKTALVLEGGIADSIPVEYALRQGYKHLVVILTRNKGYRKKNCRRHWQSVMLHTTGQWILLKNLRILAE